MNLTRHAKIIEIMESQNTISIRELAEKLSCTEMTVRRNLDQLEEQNLVRRERGYAYLLKNARRTDYYEEINENAAEKKEIAGEALKFLRPNMSICLDSGTTIQQLVNLLPDHMPLSVITPSLTAAMKLSGLEMVSVMMPGGFLHHSNLSLLIDDPEAIGKYHADIAFISCRSFQIPGGSFEHSQTLTNTKRALASIADKKILLMDHTKWNVRSIFNCIPLRQLDVIITDSKTPDEYIQKVRDAGKEIIIAGKNS